MSAPIDLNLVRAFVEVHRHGSFSAAATRLGVPRSTVSRAVSALEESTGLQLFHRTTRTVTTTRAGMSLFDRVLPSLTSLEASLTDLPETAPAPSGTLRLTASIDVGASLLADIVARFTTRYPEVSVDARFTGELVDLAKDGFDVAVRFAKGTLRDSSLVARRIGPVAFHLYAAPSYLARRGSPRSLAELADHDVVAVTGTKALGPGTPRITSDDKLFVRAVLRAGGGIGLLPGYLVDEDVVAGTLVRVLPTFEVAAGSLHVVVPTRRHVPSKVTAFRELLLEMFNRR